MDGIADSPTTKLEQVLGKDWPGAGVIFSSLMLKVRWGNPADGRRLAKADLRTTWALAGGATSARRIPSGHSNPNPVSFMRNLRLQTGHRFPKDAKLQSGEARTTHQGSAQLR